MMQKILAGFLIFAGVLAAQERLPASGTPASANLPAQAAGEGDLLAVTVYGAPELTRTVRVSNDGFIRLPMLGQPIEVQGLLPEQIEMRLVKALAGEEILVDPIVTVTLAELASRPVRVVGSVRRPLTFQADGRTTLLDALSRAEGLAPEAGAEILVTHPAEKGRPALTTRVLLKDLIENADPAANLKLAGGEEVRVPETGRVFVVGNVAKPGGFPMADADGMSVMQAMALAEGLTPFAGKMAYVYRAMDGGAKQEVTVELRKIMDRKSPDVTLTPGDILYIPDNRRSRMTASIIDKLVSFGAGTASGLLVYSASRR
jgi:polysaccharide export outer membrane protein